MRHLFGLKIVIWYMWKI